MTNTSTDSINRSNLLWALDRLALGFETSDPHIRHEAKAVAKQNILQLAYECNAQTGKECDRGV